MCEREHLAAYTFKEALPEAGILWLREFCWEKPSKKKIKETEHLQRLCSTKADGLPKQPKLDNNVFWSSTLFSPSMTHLIEYETKPHEVK